MKNFDAVKAQIEQGITVAYTDVQEMFDIVKKGGAAAHASDLQAQLDAQSAGISAQTQTLAEMAANATSLNERISVMQATIDGLTAENASVQAENLQQANLLETAASSIATLNAKIDELQAAMNPAEPAAADPGPAGTSANPAPIAQSDSVDAPAAPAAAATAAASSAPADAPAATSALADAPAAASADASAQPTQ
jgi:hypothetical protein